MAEPCARRGTTIACYGSAGRPLLLFPAASGDHLDNEQFGLVKCLEPRLLSGELRVFCIDTINRRAWANPEAHLAEQARLQALYAAFVQEEVVPVVRTVSWLAAVRKKGFSK